VVGDASRKEQKRVGNGPVSRKGSASFTWFTIKGRNRGRGRKKSAEAGLTTKSQEQSPVARRENIPLQWGIPSQKPTRKKLLKREKGNSERGGRDTVQRNVKRYPSEDRSRLQRTNYPTAGGTRGKKEETEKERGKQRSNAAVSNKNTPA